MDRDAVSKRRARSSETSGSAERRTESRIGIPRGTPVVVRLQTVGGATYVEGELVNVSLRGFAVKVEDRPENRFEGGTRCQVLLSRAVEESGLDFGEAVIHVDRSQPGYLIYGIREIGPGGSEDL